MTRYLLVDTANSFFRCKHIASKQTDSWTKVGFALHTVLAGIAKAWREHNADHVVFCLEGHSWRKSFYEPYKKNRAVARAAMTEAELEEDKLFFEAFTELQIYLAEKTNCTILVHPELEADDLIAGWIQSHPNDSHTIVSSDTDYLQLIAPNVDQYNGIDDVLITLNGYLDKKRKPVIDKKTKLPRLLEDPQWILFKKCMRGDPTDNVFSAFPGVRENGTKNKVGLREAFADRHNKGYSWNNLMLQRFQHHDGTEHKVLDDYNRNVTLVDLSAQPNDIKIKIAETIATNQQHKNKPMVGAQFLKFCGKWDLVKLSEQATQFGDILNSGYPDTTQGES